MRRGFGDAENPTAQHLERNRTGVFAMASMSKEELERIGAVLSAVADDIKPTIFGRCMKESRKGFFVYPVILIAGVHNNAIVQSVIQYPETESRRHDENSVALLLRTVAEDLASTRRPAHRRRLQ